MAVESLTEQAKKVIKVWNFIWGLAWRDPAPIKPQDAYILLDVTRREMSKSHIGRTSQARYSSIDFAAWALIWTGLLKRK